MKKLILSLTLLAGIGFSSKAQNVTIPDANFKAYLVGITTLNNNPADTEISELEAQSFNGTINCSNLGISDLTGIEAFTGNITLNCGGNNLSSLDLSACVNLTGHLHVEQNVLTLLTLPNSPDLTQLTCSGNNLSILDLTPAPNITTMWAGNNPISVFNFGFSPAMDGFNLSGNSLTSLDLTNFPNLQWLNVEVSTVLTSLDISPCTSLINLYCNQSPLLESLDMTNGNYLNFPPNWFVATDCPSLTCVTVDNVSFANQAWATAVDPGVTFSTDCSSSVPLATSLTIQGQGGQTTLTTDDGTLQMIATILPSNASQTVIWGIVSGSSFASINSSTGILTALDNGIVTVGAMTSDGSNLSATTNITISNQVLEINETKIIEQVSVFPNPTSSNLTIETTELIEKVSIYHTTGELVQTENSAAFSVEQLSRGIYLIEIKTPNGVATTRFVKE